MNNLEKRELDKCMVCCAPIKHDLVYGLCGGVYIYACRDCSNSDPMIPIPFEDLGLWPLKKADLPYD